MLTALCFSLPCFGASIRMEGGVVRVTGEAFTAVPPDGWSSVLAVYAGDGDVPPLLGSYSLEAGVLVFRPRFPIAPGMHVRAVLHRDAGPAVEAAFELPKALPLAATTRVASVYPSSSELPENTLRLYLYFSAPMQQGEAWQHIHLLDATGKPVDLAFLEIEQELWNREMTRLTVLFDPGRIKRGLVPLNEIGPSIVEGKSYTLVVDRDLLDGHGAPLAAEFRKSFRVGPPDREGIDVAKWHVAAPRAGTTDSLAIDFPKPLDYALLQHLIQVEGVAGKVAVARGETQWRFTPEQPWKAAEYQIVVDTTLEDVCGNRVGRAFDVDIFNTVSKSVSRETVKIPLKTHF